MRRASTCLVVLGLALLAVPGVASAAPTVKFKAQAVPIPGFRGTGNILGAGAALVSEYEISGTEYFGSPPPIIAINFYFPKGTVLHPTGFPTCSEEVVRDKGPIGCPKASQAGPVGTVLGYVTLGGERVEETAENFSFYKPGGGFIFFTDGHTPVSLEVYSTGAFVSLTSSPGGYGAELHVKVPEVASVPGAPYASVKTIKVKDGSAYKSHGKTIYYGRVPKSCPKGGFPLKTEVVFAENGEESTPVSVPATYKAPCPRK
ncbi:MAG TPA: hypothetical protein VMF09_02895 [Solirubrobacteraceae bacterium]|nr:hypothetical protein [Solirubrobacteraceae bacterium]